MNKGRLSNDQIKQFETEGYLVFENGCNDTAIFEELRNQLTSIFPSWKDGEFIPEGVNRDSLESPISLNVGDVLYEGCALTRRSYMRKFGKTPKLPGDCPNWLYGRKAILEASFWDNDYTSLIQNGPWTQYVKQLLNSEEIKFVGGTLENTYPGFSGHDGRFYATAARFSQDVLRSIVSVVIFVDDNNGDASLSIVPGSHKYYENINELASRAWGKDKLESLSIYSKKGLYKEMLPSCLDNRMSVRGKAGDIFLVQGRCFYSELENISKNELRSTVVLHFCDKKKTGFKYEYLKVHSVNRNDNGMLCKYTSVLQRYKPKRLYRYAKKKALIPLVRLFIKPIGLNIGAGPGWRHSKFFSLDVSKGADFVHDLTSDKPLPVELSSMNAIYSSHCIEHLTDREVIKLLKDSFDSLKCGGVIRITCPDMDLYFNAYERRDLAFFAPYLGRETNRYDSWLRYIVRSFAEPVVDMYSDEYLYKCYRNMERYELMDHFIGLMKSMDTRYLSHGMHRSWWTERKLFEKLKECGFKDVRTSSRYQSIVPEMRDPRYFDMNNPMISLWVEAIK